MKGTLLLLAGALLAFAAWVWAPLAHHARAERPRPPQPNRHRVVSSVPRAPASPRRAAPPVIPGGAPHSGGGPWRLAFDDEFNGTSLDLEKWQPNWRGAGDTSVTPPVNKHDLNCMAPSQVTQGGGVLHLTAAPDTCTVSNGTTYRYASGLVNTYKTFRFTYGYIDARINIPATSAGAAANFPAFWANSTSKWPNIGELDVMEVLGDCLGWHFHNRQGVFGGCTSLTPPAGWHTFGADWQPGSVTFYYDGREVGQVPTGITSAPMYLILDNSIDPTWGGPMVAPADMQVDYVRIWQ